MLILLIVWHVQEILNTLLDFTEQFSARFLKLQLLTKTCLATPNIFTSYSHVATIGNCRLNSQVEKKIKWCKNHVVIWGKPIAAKEECIITLKNQITLPDYQDTQ